MAEVMVHKVVLSSGKEVLLRDMKIKDQELAAQAAGQRAGENQMAMAMGMQQELIKLLLVQVDGKDIPAPERENLDSLFSYQEYQQVSQVLSKLMGTEDVGKFQMELVPSGAI
jgi:hypothetical protein